MLCLETFISDYYWEKKRTENQQLFDGAEGLYYWVIIYKDEWIQRICAMTFSLVALVTRDNMKYGNCSK